MHSVQPGGASLITDDAAFNGYKTNISLVVLFSLDIIT